MTDTLKKAVALARRFKKAKTWSLVKFSRATNLSEADRRLISVGLAELEKKGAGEALLEERRLSNVVASQRHRERRAAYVADLERQAGIKK